MRKIVILMTLSILFNNCFPFKTKEEKITEKQLKTSYQNSEVLHNNQVATENDYITKIINENSIYS